VLLALLSARLLRRFGPFRLIPGGYLLGAALHVAERLLLPVFTRPVSVIVYIHVLSLGSVLLSGFWAIINEQFDPRHARKRFGRIAGFGTLGGLAGGVMAERVAALFSVPDLLLLLTVLQLICGLVLLRATPTRTPRRAPKTPGYREIFSHAPYLYGLAGLIVFVSMTATMLDFLLKTQLVAHFGRGAALSRFFAIFYMSTSGASFIAQAGASRGENVQHVHASHEGRFHRLARAAKSKSR
jgi:ATP/ADP translocase